MSGFEISIDTSAALFRPAKYSVTLGKSVMKRSAACQHGLAGAMKRFEVPKSLLEGFVRVTELQKVIKFYLTFILFLGIPRTFAKFAQNSQ